MPELKERPTAKTRPAVSQPIADSAERAKLSSLVALRPPHLALAGQTVERLEKVTAGDRAIIHDQRDSLVELLGFGVTHDLIATAPVSKLVHAPYIEQPDLARFALKSMLETLAQTINANHIPMCLSISEPDGGRELGLFIEPADVRTFIRCAAPDPLLNDWFAQFLRAAGSALGFMSDADLMEYEADIHFDYLGVDSEMLRSVEGTALELLDADSYVELQILFERLIGATYDYEPEEFAQQLQYAYSLHSALDEVDQTERPTLPELHTELLSITDRWPRFCYEPKIKALLEQLPELIALEETLKANSAIFTAEGEHYFGEHFMTVGTDLSDDACELIDQNTNRIWEVGSMGYLKFDCKAPNSYETLLAFTQFCSKFFALCEYE